MHDQLSIVDVLVDVRAPSEESTPGEFHPAIRPARRYQVFRGSGTTLPDAQKKPAAQRPAGALRPVSLQKAPASHGAHSPSRERRVAFEYVPFGQGNTSGAGVASGQKWPGGHAAYAAAPAPQ